MENQINVNDQNTRQTEQNPVDQSPPISTQPSAPSLLLKKLGKKSLFL